MWTGRNSALPNCQTARIKSCVAFPNEFLAIAANSYDQSAHIVSTTNSSDSSNRWILEKTLSISSSACLLYTSEDTSLREESIKYFRLKDGGYLAAGYPVPVHYEDKETGEFLEINNDLEKTAIDGETYYTNADNPFEVSLPERQ